MWYTLEQLAPRYASTLHPPTRRKPFDGGFKATWITPQDPELPTAFQNSLVPPAFARRGCFVYICSLSQTRLSLGHEAAVSEVVHGAKNRHSREHGRACSPVT